MFSYLVKGDHPCFKRMDKYLTDLLDAIAYRDALEEAGYENVTIVYPITKVMEILGCKEVKPLIFRHPDIGFDLDFTATADDKILLRLLEIFSEKGYESFKNQFREMLGF